MSCAAVRTAETDTSPERIKIQAYVRFPICSSRIRLPRPRQPVRNFKNLGSIGEL
jgi:hypothetical protein